MYINDIKNNPNFDYDGKRWKISKSKIHVKPWMNCAQNTTDRTLEKKKIQMNADNEKKKSSRWNRINNGAD